MISVLYLITKTEISPQFTPIKIIIESLEIKDGRIWLCALCHFWQRQHNPRFTNNKKTVGQNSMEKVFVEEAVIVYGRPASTVLSAHQASHNFSKSAKKKDQQPVYPMFCSACLHRAPGFPPRVRWLLCFYAWRCKQVGVGSTWACKQQLTCSAM